VLVEDNDTFRETLQLVFGLRQEIQVVGSVATGHEAPALCAELAPDVVLMDYRMPGMNGRRGDARGSRCRAGDARRLPDGVRDEDRGRRVARSGGRRLPDEGRGLRSHRCRRRGCGRQVNLTAENTAVVLDSTADFPDAPDRFPNFRVRPALRPLR